eukprot:CAMPEP_0194439102 /NCGR_PEP_ID=MMETSP0176-20130528/108599_1 /TAXON_ID=216777 /ORGANISM="Proboscia alata, Strain PI-D3" /LENGTH=48 /DNA_ID= /DNA_START= /DNA_END= /DNA_ORIENTATION=
MVCTSASDERIFGLIKGATAASEDARVTSPTLSSRNGITEPYVPEISN